MYVIQNLADQFGRSPSNQELHRELHNSNSDTLHVENLSPTERKRKAEAVTTEKIAKIKMSSNSDLELPTDHGMSSIGPDLEHLATVWLSAANLCCCCMALLVVY